MKLFSIVVVSYNGVQRGSLSRVLDSIFSQHLLSELVEEVIMVNNNSQDETGKVMQSYTERYPSAVYIFEGRQGVGYARETGIKRVKTKWIMFVDDDNMLAENWLENARKYIDNNPDVGAFGGTIVPYLDEELSHHQKVVLSIVYPGLACTHLRLDEIETSGEYKYPVEIPFGAGLVILSEPLKKITSQEWVRLGRCGDALDAGEDTEMCECVKAAGHAYGYCKGMLLFHVMSVKRLEMEYQQKLFYGFGKYMAYKFRGEGKLLRPVMSGIKSFFEQKLCEFSSDERKRLSGNIFKSYNLGLLRYLIFPK